MSHIHLQNSSARSMVVLHDVIAEKKADGAECGSTPRKLHLLPPVSIRCWNGLANLPVIPRTLAPLPFMRKATTAPTTKPSPRAVKCGAISGSLQVAQVHNDPGLDRRCEALPNLCLWHSRQPQRRQRIRFLEPSSVRSCLDVPCPNVEADNDSQSHKHDSGCQASLNVEGGTTGRNTGGRLQATTKRPHIAVYGSDR